MEIWNPIQGYEGLYEVSSEGRVRSLERVVHAGRRRAARLWKARFLKPAATARGYLTVVLCRNTERRTVTVHRLVANAFLLNPMDLPVINHKDCDQQNNRSENLEWCTQLHNVLHALSARNPAPKESENV